MTSTLYPLGGVELGAPMMFVAWFNPNNPESKSGRKLWVLTYNSVASPSTLVFEVAVIDTSKGTGQGGQVYINPALGTTAIVQYTSALNTDNSGTLLFTTNTPGGNLSLTTGASPFVTGSGAGNPPAPVNLTQTAAQPWTNPYSFLTGVQYTLSNASNVNAMWYYNSGSTTSPSYKPLYTPVGILPIIYYFGCTSNAVGRSEGLGPVLTLAYCSISGKQNDPKGPCAGSKIPISGWTDQTDCVNGQSYSYCPVGTYCSGTCKSTCADDGNVCRYVPNTQGNSYECQPANPTGTGTTVKVWLIVGIVAGIIIFIALIFIFRSIFHKKDKDDGLDMDPELDSVADQV